MVTVFFFFFIIIIKWNERSSAVVYARVRVFNYKTQSTVCIEESTPMKWFTYFPQFCVYVHCFTYESWLGSNRVNMVYGRVALIYIISTRQWNKINWKIYNNYHNIMQWTFVPFFFFFFYSESAFKYSCAFVNVLFCISDYSCIKWRTK